MKQVNERILTALASERVLAKDWNSKEDEEAWKDLNKASLKRLKMR